MSEYESVLLASNGHENLPSDLQRISEIMVILKEVIHTTTSIPVETADQLVKSFDEYAELVASKASKMEGEVKDGSIYSKFIRLCHNEVVSVLGGNQQAIEAFEQAAGIQSKPVRSSSSRQLQGVDAEIHAEKLRRSVSLDQRQRPRRATQEEIEGSSFFTVQMKKASGTRNWRGVKQFFLGKLPILSWLPKYSLKNDLVGDVLAALTVGLMLIPQGMAYALLAHMPPIYGLYAGTIPMMLYTFFGTSSELSIGPAAMLSLALPSAVEGLVEDGTQQYQDLIIFLGIVIGLTLFIAGLLKFGFVLENLLSTPISNGFTQGAAVLIIMSQMKTLLHIKIPYSALSLPQILYYCGVHFHQISWWTCLGGVGSMFFIFLMLKVSSRIPAALIILIFTTFMSYILDLEKYEIAIIGNIPQGFPKPRLIDVTLSHVLEVIYPAIVCALIGFIEAVSCAKLFAARRHYKIDTSQEMIAMGVSNIIGVFFNSYPVGASLARTAVNYQTGSRTPLNQLFASSVVVIVLVWVTPVFRFTPLFTLAAIVMKGAAGLLSMEEPKFLWKMNEKGDLIELLIAFFATIGFGPIVGVVVAIGLAVLEFVYRSATPHVGIEGRVAETTLYKDTSIYPDLEELDGILILRMDSRLAFYNCNHFRDRLYAYEEDNPTKVHTTIIDASGISYVDATALHVLEDVVEDHKGKKKIRFLWADAKTPVLNSFRLSGLAEKVGKQHFFTNVQSAVEFAQKEEKILQDVKALQEKEAAEKKAQEGKSEENAVVQLEENGEGERISLDKSGERRRKKESIAEKILKGQSVFIDKLQEKMNPDVDFWKGEKIEAWV